MGCRATGVLYGSTGSHYEAKSKTRGQGETLALLPGSLSVSHTHTRSYSCNLRYYVALYWREGGVGGLFLSPQVLEAHYCAEAAREREVSAAPCFTFLTASSSHLLTLLFFL